jgi:signal transduction histidine kinase/CheY-like chemotaxis protein
MFSGFRGMMSNYREYAGTIYDEYVDHLDKTTLSNMSYYIEKHYPIVYDTERLKREAGSDWFWGIVKEWREIADAFNFAYIYYIEKKDDNYVFLMSAGVQNDDNNEWLYKPVWEGPPPAFIDEAWETKGLTFSPEPTVNEWGTMISVERPILVDGRVVGVLGIDYDISYVEDLIEHEALLQEQEENLTQKLILLLIIVFFIIMLVMCYQYWLSNTSALIPIWEKESNERTRMLLNAAPIMVNLWDKNLNIIDCNHETAKLLDLPSEKIYLENFFSFSPEYQPNGRPSREMALEAIQKAFDKGTFRLEWMLQKLNGEPVPCEVFLTRIKYKGEFTVAVYARDLREKKAAMTKEREIEESKKIIDTLENILNGLVENILVTVPETGEILFINNNMRTLYNIKEDYAGELCYKHIQEGSNKMCDFCPCHELDRDPGKIVVWIARNSITGRVYRNTDCYIEWPGGTRAHLQHAVDITELNDAKEEAVNANQTKSNFLAKISHEIRTPMNAILGITEIQLQDEKLSQNTQEAWGKIYDSGYLLLNIINDILDLSKIEAGKLEITPVSYEVASLINDTVQLNIMRFDSKAIEFDLQVDENIPSLLFGDELRIKQVLNNLLSNAFKYTDSGKVLLSVNIERDHIDETKAALVFCVKDEGQGMTNEQVARLFTEYTRFYTEANRTIEGTGLGLNITSHLVNMMGGEITVESEHGKGSTFTVRLPQGVVSVSVLGKEMAENFKHFRFSAKAQLKKTQQITREYMPYGRIMIVDDVETNLYVARGLMAPYGLSIDTVDSGFEAVDKIKDGFVYDIIFMDHFMPKMDGIEAVRIIRDFGYTNPIVALTANALSGQAEMFLANGFDDFISKPIDIRQLNAILNKLVRDKYPIETVEAAHRLKETMDSHSASVSQSPAVPQLAEIFIRDAEKAIAVLETIHRKQDAYKAGDIQAYVINVHAMKSALANIGEAELSGIAYRLEDAGRQGNTAVLSEDTPEFLEKLKEIIRKIKPKEDEEAEVEDSPSDLAYLREKLTAIQTACSVIDSKSADDALGELKQKTWSRPVKKQLDILAEHLLHSEFEEAANFLKDFDI